MTLPGQKPHFSIRVLLLPGVLPGPTRRKIDRRSRSITWYNHSLPQTMIRQEFTAVLQKATIFNRPFSRSTFRRLEHLPTTNSPIVSKLSFFNSVTGNDTQIPTFRVLDGVGKPLEGAVLPDVHVVLFSLKNILTYEMNRLISPLLGGYTKTWCSCRLWTMCFTMFNGRAKYLFMYAKYLTSYLHVSSSVAIR